MLPNNGTARVYAECNSVLHSPSPRLLHSAGGPYITRNVCVHMDKTIDMPNQPNQVEGPQFCGLNV